MMKRMHYWVFGEKSSSGKKERTKTELSLGSFSEILARTRHASRALESGTCTKT